MASAEVTEMDASQTYYHVETPLALTRTIKDPIHDFITFPAYIWSFIDTRQFQRLRAIKQLGVSYYVWAGASHNRFEHCIGVAHLAGTLVERLRTMQPELGITERDVRCVQLAGLCHDLGHGPWSHVWDGHFIPAVLPEQAWTHEDASEMMFDDLVKRNNVPIDQDDVNFIKDLIKGTVRHSALKEPPEKKFLFDIVANKRNGIDVDKFDYIARDVRAIGDHNNFSARRLIDSARVINDEICYHIKDANQVYELCTLRFSNHKRIYSHKTARAIEHMIVDVLKAAEPTIKIAKQILDPAKYVYLTDNIMERVEMSEEPSLAESRRILERIRRRDLYRCVDWGTFRYDLLSRLKKLISPEQIVHAAKELFRFDLDGKPGRSRSRGPNQDIVASLSVEDVIVDFSTLHFGMKEKNPIDFVRFYGKHNVYQSFKAGAGELSTLIPACFAEIQLRIYAKESIYYGLVQAGYRELLSTLSENEPETPPPYLNLSHPGVGSPSPSLSEPPLTPRTNTVATVSPSSGSGSRNNGFPNRSKTPSLNKFTRVDPSFAPSSPSLTAKRMKGSSIPLAPLDLKPPHRPVVSESTAITSRAEKAQNGQVRGLAVQDSLVSMTSETSEVSTEVFNSDAGTLVDGRIYRVKSAKADSDQIPMDTDDHIRAKSPTTPSPSSSKRKAKASHSNQQLSAPSADIESKTRRPRSVRRQRTADHDNASNEVDGEGSRLKRRRS
ncbi:hypothetical protein ACEPAF_7082 [Sanghuangporus sanghuang]